MSVLVRITALGLFFGTFGTTIGRFDRRFF